MEKNNYIAEILSQPEALAGALAQVDLGRLAPLCRDVQAGKFDRIVVTGMGASLYAAYPAYLILAQAGLPAHWIDAAELLHYAPGLVTPRTLVWMLSQSGRSAELIPLLDPARARQPAFLLGTVNDLDSPLAQAADLVQPIDAPVERTVSTRTYTNTLAVGQLAALALASGSTRLDAPALAPAYRELQAAVAPLQTYLDGWEEHVARLDQAVHLPKSLALLGRGPSLAAVLTGALILAEAAKAPTIPMNAAEFRHGPLEMAGPRLTALVLAGAGRTLELTRRMAGDLRRFGAQAYLVASSPDESLPTLAMPPAEGAGLPLAEILPVQLLTIALALQNGLEPGHFYQAGKVVLSE